MQFNIKKIKLIHFYFKRSFDLENEAYLIKIEDSTIQPKSLVKWLGI